MTQQDDITQRPLTDAEIQALWDEACKDSPQAPGWNRHIRFARLLLSQVRAPVAHERAPEQAAPGRQYHILKTDPEVFQALLSGAKTFEIRLNDRDYAVGDVLGLRETRFTGAEMRAGAPLVYTGRECQRFISHVLTGYGLAEGWCCLSFRLPHAGRESAPVAGEATYYAVMHGNALYGIFDTEAAAEACKAQGHPDAPFSVKPLYAAPQASAEDVRNAALYLLREARKMLPAFATAEAIGAWSEKVRKFGAGEVIDVPPQADKDGGQQLSGNSRQLDSAKGAGDDAGITASEDHIRPDLDRGFPGSFTAFSQWVMNQPNDQIYVHSAQEGFLAGVEWCRQQGIGVCLPEYLNDLRYHDQYRVGWNRCVDAYRAALSTTQAEQGDTREA